MSRQHLLTHGNDLRFKLMDIMRLSHNLDTYLFELLTYIFITCTEACTHQRLMLPKPSLVQLIFAERAYVRNQHATCTIRTQSKVRVIKNRGRCQATKPVIDADPKPSIDFARFWSVILVEKHNIQIRCVPKLLTPKLAVSDHREFALFSMPRLQISPNCL